MANEHTHSEIYIYNSRNLTEDKNWLLDGLNGYENNPFLLLTSILDFQFIKPALDIVIKVYVTDFMQSRLNPEGDYPGPLYQLNSSNYIKIINKTLNALGTDYIVWRPFYYFVKSMKWASQNCIEYTLHMDVLNTIGLPEAIKPLYTFDKRTRIMRTHKNRYNKIGNKLYPIIDLYSEGIQPSLINDSSFTILNDSLNMDFYLMYKNSEDDSESSTNVVNTFLITSTKPTYKISISGRQLSPSSLTNGIYYYVTASAVAGNYVVYRKLPSMTEVSLHNIPLITLRREGNYILISSDNNVTWEVTTQVNLTWDARINYSSALTSDLSVIGTYPYFDLSNTDTERNVVGLGYDEINKTDSRIIKIIKIPYAPSNGFTITAGVISFDNSKWIFDTSEQILRLKNNSIKFENSMTFSSNPLSPIFSKTLNDNVPQINMNRNNDYEPKILHSDFYQPKVFYDSFSYSFKLEHVLISDSIPADQLFHVTFKPTTTINSRFLFTFNYTLDMNETDFPKVLTIARSNEEVIYNSPYINYLRAGYNYDVKNKTRQEVFSWASAIGSIAGGALSIAFGSKTLGAGFVASGLLQIAGAINTTISAETSFEKNLNQLKWQSNSVAGSDDVDLFSEYGKNRLLYKVYSCSPRLKQNIYDLFYYNGYVADFLDNPANYINTRYYFNFIQAELVINRSVGTIPDNAWEEFKKRFSGGVTIFHRLTDNTWELSQTKENWEVSLL